jgi:hypothetical protein
MTVRIFKKEDNKHMACDHTQDLKRLEDEINSLQKSVANLRKDIPVLTAKLLAEAESRNRRVLLS